MDSSILRAQNSVGLLKIISGIGLCRASFVIATLNWCAEDTHVRNTPILVFGQFGMIDIRQPEGIVVGLSHQLQVLRCMTVVVEHVPRSCQCS
jgi:hypothetical protein